MVSASDTPTVAVDAEPDIAPAVLLAPAVWLAVADRAPLTAVVPFAGSVPRLAVVVTFESVMAAAGTAAIEPPPVAPILASVVARSVAVALRLRLRAPVRVTPSGTLALVVSLIRLRATEAPNPKVDPPPAPAPIGSAFTVELAFETALKVASGVAPVRLTGPRISAVVVRFSRFSAKDPAIET